MAQSSLNLLRTWQDTSDPTMHIDGLLQATSYQYFREEQIVMHVFDEWPIALLTNGPDS